MLKFTKIFIAVVFPKLTIVWGGGGGGTGVNQSTSKSLQAYSKIGRNKVTVTHRVEPHYDNNYFSRHFL